MHSSILFASLLLVTSGLILLAAPTHAQDQQTATITGIVSHAETGAPLPGVHVFIVQSMKGTVTDSSGHYRLTDVPRSRTRLVGSRVGFRPVHRTVQIRESRTYTVDLALEPTVVAGEEIVIEGERDEEATRRMERFRIRFLGVSKIARSAEIVNPAVLRFEEKDNALIVRATEPIVINHPVLGYRIHYTLREFIAKGEAAQYSIRIVFEGQEESTLLPNDPPILIDTRGSLVRPYSVIFRGAMSKTGVADLLPLEYTPDDGDQP